MKSNALTQIQADTLNYIKDYVKINNFSPTRAEIAEAFDINPNAAQARVLGLIRKGAVTQTEGVMRSTFPIKGFKVVIRNA